MEKAEGPGILSEGNQDENVLQNANISHQEWGTGKRRVEGLLALVTIQFGYGMV